MSIQLFSIQVLFPGKTGEKLFWSHSVFLMSFINITPTRPGLSVSACNMENVYTLSFICPFFIFNPLLFVVGFLLLLLFWVLFVASLSSYGTLDCLCHTFNIPSLVMGSSFYILCLSSESFLCKPCQFLILPGPVPFFFFYSLLGSFAAAQLELHFQSFLLSWTVFIFQSLMPWNYTLSFLNISIFTLSVILLFLAVTWFLSSKGLITSTCE